MNAREVMALMREIWWWGRLRTLTPVTPLTPTSSKNARHAPAVACPGMSQYMYLYSHGPHVVPLVPRPYYKKRHGPSQVIPQVNSSIR
jgi:hypothetical protein